MKAGNGKKYKKHDSCFVYYRDGGNISITSIDYTSSSCL